MRREGHVERTGEKRSEYRVLMGKRKGKAPVGRLRSGCEDNIKMDHQGV
jgi:hypothetical protein